MTESPAAASALAFLARKYGDKVRPDELVERFPAVWPSRDPAPLAPIFNHAFNRIAEAGLLASPTVAEKMLSKVQHSEVLKNNPHLPLLFMRPTPAEQYRAASKSFGAAIGEHAVSAAKTALADPALSRGELLSLVRETKNEYRQPATQGVLEAGIDRLFALTDWARADDVIESVSAATDAQVLVPELPLTVKPEQAFEFGVALMQAPSTGRYLVSPRLKELGEKAIELSLNDSPPLAVLEQHVKASDSSKTLWPYRQRLLAQLAARSDLSSPEVVTTLLASGSAAFDESQVPDLVAAMKTQAAGPTNKFELLLRFRSAHQPSLQAAARQAANELFPQLSKADARVLLPRLRGQYVQDDGAATLLVARLARLCDWSDAASIVELENDLAPNHMSGPIDLSGFDVFHAIGAPHDKLLRALAFLDSDVPVFRERAASAMATALESASPSEVLDFAEAKSLLTAEDRTRLPQALSARISQAESRANHHNPARDAARAKAVQLLERFTKTPDLPESERLKALLRTGHYGNSREVLKYLEGTSDPAANLAAAMKQIDSGPLKPAAIEWLGEILADPAADFATALSRLNTVGRQHSRWTMAHYGAKSGPRLQGAEIDTFRSTVFDPAFRRLCELADWGDDAQVRQVLGVATTTAATELEVPAHYRARVFGHGRERDLTQANWLSSTSKGALKQLADQVIDSSFTLAQAMETAHGTTPSGAELEPARKFLTRHFTSDAAKKYVSTGPPSELGQRLAAALKQLSQLPAKSPERATIFAEAISPEFQRWCSQLDWADDASVERLLAFQAAVPADLPVPGIAEKHWARLVEKSVPWLTANVQKMLASRDTGLQTAAAQAIASAATSSTSFDEGVALFNAIPRGSMDSKVLQLVQATSKRNIDTWQETLDHGAEELGSALTQATERLERHLRDDLRDGPADRALEKVSQLIAASPEQDRFVDEVLKRQGTWVSASLLYKTASYETQPKPLGIHARRVEQAISRFPGNTLGLVASLSGHGAINAVFTDQPTNLAAATKTVESLKTEFDSLDPSIRKQIVDRCLLATLRQLNQLPPPQKATMQKRVDDALDQHLFAALNADPDTAALSTRIRTVYDALPDHVQARLLTDLMLSDSAHDSPEQLKRMLISVGLVAIKAGQQMSEDPSVPSRFRAVLGDLRDKNNELPPAAVWKAIPPQERPTYAAVGPRMGTGSVKQVNLMRRVDGVEEVGAVLKPQVASDIDSTLGALSVVPDTKHLVGQLTPMLKREVDLTVAAASFDVLRSTPVGQSPNINIPIVRVAYPTFLARSAAPGESVAELLRQGPLDKAQRQALYALHVGLARAALETDVRRPGAVQSSGPQRTFVLTDPHEANVALDGTRPGLFDPDQFESLSPDEANAFVSMLASLRKPALEPPQQARLVAQLTALSQLSDPADGGPPLPSRIEAAFEATKSEPSANVGRKLQLLLLTASKSGVAVPTGYMGLAKMLHSLESQSKELGIRSAVSDVIAALHLDQQGPFGRLFSKVHTAYGSMKALND